MEQEWSRKEKLASAIIGSIATVFLIIVVTGVDSANVVEASRNGGVAFVGYALALSPKILFEKVSLRWLKESNLPLFGASALFMLVGQVLLAFSYVYWFLK